MTETRERIPYLYFLRIFAILMVIMLHCISPYMSEASYYGTRSWYVYLFLNAVSRCGVPLFFMISGYLMLNDAKTLDIRAYYRRRLPRILRPLLIWNVIYWLFNCGLNGKIPSFSELCAQMLDSGTSYHLWYLYTLSAIYLTAPFLKRIADSCTAKELMWFETLILLCPTLRPFINTVTPVYIYLFDPLFNGYMGFFVLGFILGKQDVYGKSLWLFAFFGIIGIVTSMLANHLSSSAIETNLIFNSGYNICHYLAAAALFVIFKNIKFSKRGLAEKAAFASKNTFGMYLVHAGVIDILIKFFMIHASPVVCSLYLFALTVPISFALAYVFGKIKYLV